MNEKTLPISLLYPIENQLDIFLGDCLTFFISFFFTNIVGCNCAKSHL